MEREYSFTLTVPLVDLARVEAVLLETKQKFPNTRISRKTDSKECARFYLSFPFSGARPDLAFMAWLNTIKDESWDLFGPTHGRWGLC